jgi:hypothetical protein
MKHLFLCLVVGILLASCTDPKGSERVLAQQGFSDVKITGYKFFACSEDDIFSTGFIAKSPSGNEVKGCVCRGLFKGATIRFK